MITKRLLALGIAGVMLFSMAACGGSTSGETGSGGETSRGGSDTQVSQVSDSSDSSGTLAESAGPNTVKSEETLVVSMASEPATLWTAGSGTQDNQCLIIQNCMQDRLVTYDKENNEVLPSLATSWEWLDDYRIQFTLRDDVTMSDGTPFEAEDVLYTVQTAAEYSSTIDCGKYYDVENCEVVDDHTFIMALNVIAPDFITMLAEAQYGIVSEGDVEAAGGVEAAANQLWEKH